MLKLTAFLVCIVAATSSFAQSAKRPAPVEVRRATAVGEIPIARATAVVSPNDEARFLAGLPVAGPLEALTQTAAWRTHAAELNAAWQRMEQRQLSTVRLWAPGVPQAGTLLYFFSGPDFLYADLLFPQSSTYVLCAIEPVGTVGDLLRLNESELAGALGSLRQSMSTMLKFHYFITKELRTDLARPQLGGTLPILYVFLARAGCTIREVAPLANGVRIAFSTASGEAKTLYYFRTDLSNGGGNAAFFKFCGQFRGAVALLKSASYLLHGDSFSRCRDFLLQNTSAIVQDDSGIPFRAFTPDRWTTRLFGNYTGTEGIFSKYQQPDLLDAYRRATPAPLGFAFGYQWRPDKSALIIATRR